MQEAWVLAAHRWPSEGLFLKSSSLDCLAFAAFAEHTAFP